MQLTSLDLVLENTNFSSFPNIDIFDRKSKISSEINVNKNLIFIKTKVSLPNIIYIYHYGNLFLKEFWLGRVRANQNMLEQIFLYSTTSSPKDTIVTQNWHSPGTTKIELFDPSFIEYHLHYYNTFSN